MQMLHTCVVLTFLVTGLEGVNAQTDDNRVSETVEGVKGPPSKPIVRHQPRSGVAVVVDALGGVWTDNQAGNAKEEEDISTGSFEETSSQHKESDSNGRLQNVSHAVQEKTSPTLHTEKVAVQKEDHYHALLLAVPLVIQNLTNYSGLISVDNREHPTVPHKFGNIESDKSLLLDNVHGLVKLMQEISHDAQQACPLNSSETAINCLGKALCLIQSQIDAVKNTTEKKEDLQKYALYEEMYSRFNDVSWPLVVTQLQLGPDQKNTAAYGYMAPAQHSCHGTYDDVSVEFIETGSEDSAEAAAYRTSAALLSAAKATHAVFDSHTHNSSVHKTLAALWNAWEPSCKLLECDSTNYLDLFRASHSHSMALMEMGASAHHMQVHIRTRQRLERRMQHFLGDHGSHFQPHILRDEESDPRFRAAAKQYFARSRGSLLQFATEYPKKRVENLNTLQYPLSLVDTEKMQEFFEARGKHHVLERLRSKEGFDQIEDADSDADSMALVEEEDQDEVEEESEDEARGGKGRRRKGSVSKAVKKTTKKTTKSVSKTTKTVAKGASKTVKAVAKSGKDLKGVVGKIAKDAGKGVSKAYKNLPKSLRDASNGLSQSLGNVGDALTKFGNGVANGVEQLGNDIAFVADVVGDALNDFVDWVLSLFECLGQFHETVAVGYGKKFEFPPPVGPTGGVGVSFGVASDFDALTVLLLGGDVNLQLKVSLSMVVGAVPGNGITGGLRTGVGIALGIGCSSNAGCNIGIAVGSVGSALIPGSAGGRACAFGIKVIIGGLDFTCFYSYTVVVTAMCCKFNIITGSSDCR